MSSAIVFASTPGNGCYRNWCRKSTATEVTAEITGADGGPVRTEELSTLEIARRVAFLLASAGKENS